MHCNSMYYHSLPNIHLVMNNLRKIQVETNLKINSIARGEWGHRSGTTLQKIEHIKYEYEK